MTSHCIAYSFLSVNQQANVYLVPLITIFTLCVSCNPDVNAINFPTSGLILSQEPFVN